MSDRLQAMGQPKYANGFELTLQPDSLDDPFGWKKPRLVFVNSMSDLFHKDVSIDYILRVFKVMELTPRHTYQILTKRAERLAELSPVIEWPDNVWMGVSVENQEAAEERIPHLLKVPAKVRFLSVEPLLGPLELGHLWKHCPTHDFSGGMCVGYCSDARWIHWVIVGGESGPSSRPMHPSWPLAIRDQCVSARIPFFFKQWGEWCPPIEGDDFNTAFGQSQKLPAFLVAPDGTVHCFYPRDRDESEMDVAVRKGKKKAGRLLDGRTWDEFPARN